MRRAFGPWAHPGRRIAKYAVTIAYRFHFDPRVIDEWTTAEFDQFAGQCDAMDRQEQQQERERAARSRTGGMTRRR